MSMPAPIFFESSYEVSPYEDGISNRQRRALRGPSAHARLATARQAQADSGVRVRIARKVLNQGDFKSELKIWIPSVQNGVAARKSLGNLAMTIFDTSQQPLRYSDGITQDSLEENLAEQYPALYAPTKPLEVTGTALFGSKARPFIGLTFAPGPAFTELRKVQAIVAPELALDSSHQLKHQPHVSLGQVFSYEQALVIQDKLSSNLPGYVQLAPADVCVDTAA